MKFKKGDKVRIKSLEWYNTNKDSSGDIDCQVGFEEDMLKYFGLETTVTYADGSYRVDIDNGKWSWEDMFFEEDIPDNTKKYGQKDEDIITICQNRNLSFCYGNALKYAKRIAMVAEMPDDEQHLYKHTYHKGGQLDLDKMEDYIKREAEVDYESAEFLFEECMEILGDVA